MADPNRQRAGRRGGRAAGALALFLVMLFVLGCSGADETETGVARSPILVIGVDGLEWDVVLPLQAQGRMPHLTRLMDKGSYGELETFLPTHSPVIWTTIATGKGHEQHGIHSFARRLPDGNLSLYNNLDRSTKAIWNILSDYGKSLAVIGWWMTYPVEEINGVMVAQTNTIDQLDTRRGKHVWKGTLLKGIEGQVYPVARQNEMISVLEDVNAELPALTRQIFGEFSFPLSTLGERLWNNCRWAFRADATYLRIALQLARSDPLPDLTLVYFGGPDVVGHRFWRYMQPGRYAHEPSAEQLANFGSVIEDYYAFVDESIGRLLEAYGPDTTVFVISDHGMKPVNLEATFDPDSPPADVNSAEHQDAPPGVFIASGPSIRPATPTRAPGIPARSDLEMVGGVLDVTPTLLALMGISAGADMQGRVLTRILSDDAVARVDYERIATHDTDEFLHSRGVGAPLRPDEEERLEQLRSLGYIGGGEKN